MSDVLQISLRRASDQTLVVVISSDALGSGGRGTPLHRAQLDTFSDASDKLFILFSSEKQDYSSLLIRFTSSLLLSSDKHLKEIIDEALLAAPCCHFMGYITPNKLIIN